MRMSYVEFLKRALIVVAVAVIPIVIWYLFGVVLIAFGAGIVSITYLFGAIAIIFAAPIVVVVFAAVTLIYVRDTLGERTALTRKLR